MWEKFDTSNDKFYDEILSKAKIKLPEIVKSDQRFVIPDVESNVEGNRTFSEISKIWLQRLIDQDHMSLNFLQTKLVPREVLKVTELFFKGNTLKLN